MLATPQIVQTNAQAAAVIRLTIPRSEMMKVFGPAVGDLMTTLAAQGVEPVGAVFAHHLKMTPDTFDFELGVKVAAPVKATGRVKPGELPAAKVARTVYRVHMKASRPPGPSSIRGSGRTATNEPTTCGRCIRSARNRPLIPRTGARN
jgi:effector-binding domain-containing protein